MRSQEIKVRKHGEYWRDATKEGRVIKRRSLQDLGFINEEVIKYLAEQTSVEKIEEIIEKLSVFSDKEWAIELIERYRQMGGLNIENSLKKIKSANEFLKRYQLPVVSEKEILERFPGFISRNTERINFSLITLGELSKSCRKEELSTSTIIDRITRFLVPNPYLVFSYLEQTRPKNINETYKISDYIKKTEKKERKRIIQEVKGNLPDTIEKLKESKDPYENEFLLKLARQLELYEKSKEKKKAHENLR